MSSDNWKDYANKASEILEADKFFRAEKLVASKEDILKFDDDKEAYFEFALLFGASKILQIADKS